MSVRHDLIPCYEAIAATSASMLAAARGGDWDALVGAERECASQIRQLQAIEAEAALKLDPTHNRERVRILQEILRHDAEIRELTQHWLRGLENLLRSTGLNRMVRGAYGNPDPTH